MEYLRVNPSDDAATSIQPPSAPDGPPGVVLAAAIVTWTAASITAALTFILSVLALLLGGPTFDAFQSRDLQAYVAATALVVITLSVAADVLAYLVFRMHRWARWALIALSVISAACAAMLGYYLAPLLITAAALVDHR